LALRARCSFLHGLTWAHAPVELTRIFDAKVKAFMKTILKADKDESGVLGRVTDYVIRYEVRHLTHPLHTPLHARLKQRDTGGHILVVLASASHCLPPPATAHHCQPWQLLPPSA